MSTPSRQRNKIRTVLCEHLIPEQAVFGTIFLAKDTQNIWYATREGLVVSLSDILNNAPVVHTPPRHGADGKDGVSIKGERGERGANGSDGAAGRDGVGTVGATGAQGRPGRDCVCRTELAEARLSGVESSVQEVNAKHTALTAQVAALRAEIQALVDLNKNAGVYLEWLRARREARQGAKQ